MICIVSKISPLPKTGDEVELEVWAEDLATLAVAWRIINHDARYAVARMEKNGTCTYFATDAHPDRTRATNSVRVELPLEALTGTPAAPPAPVIPFLPRPPKPEPRPQPTAKTRRTLRASL